MDPITHGLTGALIGKAFFAERPRGGADDSAKSGTEKGAASATGRIAIGVCTVAAMFPDVDFFLEPFVERKLSMLELHRGVTHSLVSLPLITLTMATLTWWGLSVWRRIRTRHLLGNVPPPARSAASGTTVFHWTTLAFMWAAGILSHIFLDVPTSWGTMIWAPLANTRVTLDWVFIIDLALTGTVLLPQLAAWIYRRPRGAPRRAAIACGAAAAGVLGAHALARSLGTSFPGWSTAVMVFAVVALLLGPWTRSWGFRVRRAAWCRAGLIALVGYYGLCAFGHRSALVRVERYVDSQGLQAEAIGALPMPPVATRWLGLVRTADGVHAARFDLAENPGTQFEFVAHAKPPEPYRQALARLPEVRTYLWFARFPVARYTEAHGRHTVVFTDLRFFPRNSSQPAPFQYRVVMNEAAEVIEQGWVR